MPAAARPLRLGTTSFRGRTGSWSETARSSCRVGERWRESEWPNQSTRTSLFQNGRALEALCRYEQIFEGAFTIDELDTYDETGRGADRTGSTRHLHAARPAHHVHRQAAPTLLRYDAGDLAFVECDSGEERERLFVALAEDGRVFMPLDNYGFSRRYGWVQDRFGVPWQLNLR